MAALTSSLCPRGQPEVPAQQEADTRLIPFRRALTAGGGERSGGVGARCYTPPHKVRELSLWYVSQAVVCTSPCHACASVQRAACSLELTCQPIAYLGLSHPRAPGTRSV